MNLFVREHESFVRYEHDPANKNKISYGTINVISEDNNGNIWIGTYNGGLNCINDKTQKIIRFTHNPDDHQSLSQNNVYAIFQDRSGLLWVGTEAGLNCFNLEKNTIKRIYPDPDKINYNTIYSIIEDKSRTLWIGTRGGLINLDSNRSVFSFFDDQNQSNKSDIPKIIFKLYFDRKDNIWLATSGFGLTEYNPVKKIFTPNVHDSKDPFSIISDRTMTAFLDRQGTHWVVPVMKGLLTSIRLRNKFHIILSATG